MAEQKIFAGHARPPPPPRRSADAGGDGRTARTSRPSYLNLIERNQRPLTAALMLRLADLFDFDPRSLAADEPGGGADALRRRLADPLFADLAIDRAEVEEWLAAAPGGAEAFARAFDRLREARRRPRRAGGDDPIDAVRREIERWRNHFADLDAAAESARRRRCGSATPTSMARSPSGCASSTSSPSASCRST